MGLKWSRIGAARRRFKDRRLHLKESFLEIEIANGLPEFGAALDHRARFGVEQDVEISLAQPRLFVFDAEMFRGNRQERLCEHLPVAYFERWFSTFRFECTAR